MTMHKNPEPKNQAELKPTTQAKTTFQSSFKAWIRIVAFIVVAIFLPEQVAQAVEYDWRVLWNKPGAVTPYSPILTKDPRQLDIAVAVRNILKDISGKPVTAIKISPTLTINLEKPLNISKQRIEEIYNWLAGKPCGAKALYDFLAYKGVAAQEQDIAVMALTTDILSGVLKPEGTPKIIKSSIYALSRASEFFGAKLYPVKFDLKQGLSTVPALPFIAHLTYDHYILVTRITDDKVYFADEHKEEFLPKDKFLDKFSGYALVTSFSEQAQLLSDKEAQGIKGGYDNGFDPDTLSYVDSSAYDSGAYNYEFDPSYASFDSSTVDYSTPTYAGVTPNYYDAMSSFYGADIASYSFNNYSSTLTMANGNTFQNYYSGNLYDSTGYAAQQSLDQMDRVVSARAFTMPNTVNQNIPANLYGDALSIAQNGGTIAIPTSVGSTVFYNDAGIVKMEVYNDDLRTVNVSQVTDNLTIPLAQGTWDNNNNFSMHDIGTAGGNTFPASNIQSQMPSNTFSHNVPGNPYGDAMLRAQNGEIVSMPNLDGTGSSAFYKTEVGIMQEVYNDDNRTLSGRIVTDKLSIPVSQGRWENGTGNYYIHDFAQADTSDMAYVKNALGKTVVWGDISGVSRDSAVENIYAATNRHFGIERQTQFINVAAPHQLRVDMNFNGLEAGRGTEFNFRSVDGRSLAQTLAYGGNLPTFADNSNQAFSVPGWFVGNISGNTIEGEGRRTTFDQISYNGLSFVHTATYSGNNHILTGLSSVGNSDGAIVTPIHQDFGYFSVKDKYAILDPTMNSNKQGQFYAGIRGDFSDKSIIYGALVSEGETKYTYSKGGSADNPFTRLGEFGSIADTKRTGNDAKGNMQWDVRGDKLVFLSELIVDKSKATAIDKGPWHFNAMGEGSIYKNIGNLGESTPAAPMLGVEIGQKVTIKNSEIGVTANASGMVWAKDLATNKEFTWNPQQVLQDANSRIQKIDPSKTIPSIGVNIKGDIFHAPIAELKQVNTDLSKGEKNKTQGVALPGESTFLPGFFNIAGVTRDNRVTTDFKGFGGDMEGKSGFVIVFGRVPAGYDGTGNSQITHSVLTKTALYTPIIDNDLVSANNLRDQSKLDPISKVAVENGVNVGAIREEITRGSLKASANIATLAVNLHGNEVIMNFSLNASREISGASLVYVNPDSKSALLSGSYKSSNGAELPSFTSTGGVLKNIGLSYATDKTGRELGTVLRGNEKGEVIIKSISTGINRNIGWLVQALSNSKINDINAHLKKALPGQNIDLRASGAKEDGKNVYNIVDLSNSHMQVFGSGESAKISTSGLLFSVSPYLGQQGRASGKVLEESGKKDEFVRLTDELIKGNFAVGDSWLGMIRGAVVQSQAPGQNPQGQQKGGSTLGSGVELAWISPVARDSSINISYGKGAIFYDQNSKSVDFSPIYSAGAVWKDVPTLTVKDIEAPHNNRAVWLEKSGGVRYSSDTYIGKVAGQSGLVNITNKGFTGDAYKIKANVEEGGIYKLDAGKMRAELNRLDIAFQITKTGELPDWHLSYATGKGIWKENLGQFGGERKFEVFDLGRVTFEKGNKEGLPVLGAYFPGHSIIPESVITKSGESNKITSSSFNPDFNYFGWGNTNEVVAHTARGDIYRRVNLIESGVTGIILNPLEGGKYFDGKGNFVIGSADINTLSFSPYAQWHGIAQRGSRTAPDIKEMGGKDLIATSTTVLPSGVVIRNWAGIARGADDTLRFGEGGNDFQISETLLGKTETITHQTDPKIINAFEEFFKSKNGDPKDLIKDFLDKNLEGLEKESKSKGLPESRQKEISAKIEQIKIQQKALESIQVEQKVIDALNNELKDLHSILTTGIQYKVSSFVTYRENDGQGNYSLKNVSYGKNIQNEHKLKWAETYQDIGWGVGRVVRKDNGELGMEPLPEGTRTASGKEAPRSGSSPLVGQTLASNNGKQVALGEFANLPFMPAGLRHAAITVNGKPAAENTNKPLTLGNGHTYRVTDRVGGVLFNEGNTLVQMGVNEGGKLNFDVVTQAAGLTYQLGGAFYEGDKKEGTVELIRDGKITGIPWGFGIDYKNKTEAEQGGFPTQVSLSYVGGHGVDSFSFNGKGELNTNTGILTAIYPFANPMVLNNIYIETDKKDGNVQIMNGSLGYFAPVIYQYQYVNEQGKRQMPNKANFGESIPFNIYEGVRKGDGQYKWEARAVAFQSTDIQKGEFTDTKGGFRSTTEADRQEYYYGVKGLSFSPRITQETAGNKNEPSGKGVYKLGQENLIHPTQDRSTGIIRTGEKDIVPVLMGVTKEGALQFNPIPDAFGNKWIGPQLSNSSREITRDSAILYSVARDDQGRQRALYLGGENSGTVYFNEKTGGIEGLGLFETRQMGGRSFEQKGKDNKSVELDVIPLVVKQDNKSGKWQWDTAAGRWEFGSLYGNTVRLMQNGQDNPVASLGIKYQDNRASNMPGGNSLHYGLNAAEGTNIKVANEFLQKAFQGESKQAGETPILNYHPGKGILISQLGLGKAGEFFFNPVLDYKNSDMLALEALRQKNIRDTFDAAPGEFGFAALLQNKDPNATALYTAYLIAVPTILLTVASGGTAGGLLGTIFGKNADKILVRFLFNPSSLSGKLIGQIGYRVASASAWGGAVTVGANAVNLGVKGELLGLQESAKIWGLTMASILGAQAIQGGMQLLGRGVIQGINHGWYIPTAGRSFTSGLSAATTASLERIAGGMTYWGASTIASYAGDSSSYAKSLQQMGSNKDGLSMGDFAKIAAWNMFSAPGRMTLEAWYGKDWKVGNDDNYVKQLSTLRQAELGLIAGYLNKQGVGGAAVSTALGYATYYLAAYSPAPLLALAMRPGTTLMELSQSIHEILTPGSDARPADLAEIGYVAGAILGGYRGYKNMGKDIKGLARAYYLGQETALSSEHTTAIANIKSNNIQAVKGPLQAGTLNVANNSGKLTNRLQGVYNAVYTDTGINLSSVKWSMRSYNALEGLGSIYQSAGTANLVTAGVSLGIAAVKNGGILGKDGVFQKSISSLYYNMDNVFLGSFSVVGLGKALGSISPLVTSFVENKLSITSKTWAPTVTAGGIAAGGLGLYLLGSTNETIGKLPTLANILANSGAVIMGLSGAYLLGRFNRFLDNKWPASSKASTWYGELGRGTGRYFGNAAIGIPSLGLIWVGGRNIINPLVNDYWKEKEEVRLDSPISREKLSTEEKVHNFLKEHGITDLKGAKVDYQYNEKGEITGVTVLRRASYEEASRPYIFGFERLKPPDFLQNKAYSDGNQQKYKWDKQHNKPAGGAEWPYLLAMGSTFMFFASTGRIYKNTYPKLAESLGGAKGFYDGLMATPKQRLLHILEKAGEFNKVEGLGGNLKVFSKIAGPSVAMGTGLLILSNYGEEISSAVHKLTDAMGGFKNISEYALMGLGAGLAISGWRSNLTWKNPATIAGFALAALPPADKLFNLGITSGVNSIISDVVTGGADALRDVFSNESNRRVAQYIGWGAIFSGLAKGIIAKEISIAPETRLSRNLAGAYAGVSTVLYDWGIKGTGGTLFTVIPMLHGVVEGTSYLFNSYVIPYTNTSAEREFLGMFSAFWDQNSAKKYETASALWDKGERLSAFKEAVNVGYKAGLFGVKTAEDTKDASEIGKLKVSNPIELAKDKGAWEVLKQIDTQNLAFAGILAVGMGPLQSWLSNIKAGDFGRRFRAMAEGLETSASLGLGSLVGAETAGFLSQGTNRMVGLAVKGTVEEVIVEQVIDFTTQPVFALLGSLKMPYMDLAKEIVQEVGSPNGMPGSRAKAQELFRLLFNSQIVDYKMSDTAKAGDGVLFNLTTGTSSNGSNPAINFMSLAQGDQSA
ncbi:MAG: cysteine peptidase family C39 domain-containing protein, partial [Candidatus Omnitrophica bacterium]|nr:cysteine peptidase family C39 domain-containing protein [Candidatus Omnitrophota bacterium]